MIAPEKSIDSLREAADALARNLKLVQVHRDACHNPDIRARALKDPRELLRSREIIVEPGLVIEFFEPPSTDLPFWDWIPFILEFTNCRTVWVPDCDESAPPLCRLRSETICLGYRIYPNPIQPGPIGRLRKIKPS